MALRKRLARLGLLVGSLFALWLAAGAPIDIGG